MNRKWVFVWQETREEELNALFLKSGWVLTAWIILLSLEHWFSNCVRRYTGPPVANFMFPQAHFIDNVTAKYNLDNFCRLIFSFSFSQRIVHTFFLRTGFFKFSFHFCTKKIQFILQMHSESSVSFINILQILKSLKATGLEVLYCHWHYIYHSVIAC